MKDIVVLSLGNIKKGCSVHETYTILILILLISFIVRIYLVFVSPLDDDEPWYLMDAYNIVNGLLPFRDFHTRSPLYIYTLALVSYISDNNIFAARAMSAIFTTFSGAIIFAISRRFMTEKYSIFASFIFLINPITMRYGATVMTEPMAIFLVLTSVYFILRYLSIDNGFIGSKHFAIVSSLLLFSAILVRRSSVVVFVIVLLVTFVFYHYQNRGLKRFLRDMAPFYIPFVLPFILVFTLLTLWRGLDYAIYMYFTEAIPQNVYSNTYMHWFLFYLSITCIVPLMFAATTIIRPLFEWIDDKFRSVFFAYISSVPIYLMLIVANAHITTIPALNYNYIIFALPYSRIFITLSLLLLSVLMLVYNYNQFASPKNILNTMNLAFHVSCITLALLFSINILHLNDLRLVPMTHMAIILFLCLISMAYIYKIMPEYDKESRLFLKYIAFGIMALSLLYMGVIIRSNPILFKVVIVFISIFILSIPLILVVTFRFTTVVARFSNMVWDSRYLIFLLSCIIAILPLCLDVSGILPFAILVIIIILIGMLPFIKSNTVLIIITSIFIGFVGLLGFVLSPDIMAITSIWWSLALIPLCTLLASLLPLVKVRHRNSLTHFIVLSLPVAYLIFYITRPWVMPPYLYEIIPFLSIPIGFAFLWLDDCQKHGLKEEKNMHVRFSPVRGTSISLPYAIISLAIISALFTTHYYGIEEYYIIENYNEMHPSIASILDAAQYIKAHTDEGEEIFAWPIYAYAANRPMVSNISRPFAYTSQYVAISDYPSTEDLIRYMDMKKIRIVVIDFYMSTYILPANPQLEAYIHHKYVSVKHFDQCVIMYRIEYIGCNGM